MVAALGLLTACDPSKDSIGMPGDSGLTSDQLTSGFTVKQYSDETYTTEAADGNYFTFTTSPSRVVTVYQLDDEGNRNVLVSGVANGKFKIVPKRGNPSEQTYYIETKDFNGNTISGSKTATVFVPSELDPVVRLLASDDGAKIFLGIIMVLSCLDLGATLDTLPVVVIHSPTVSGGLALLQN